jgi:1-deoxy-D-xylulose-5-phosphate synthase
MDLRTIQDPRFLKSLSMDELNELAGEIRSFLIESISRTGGHLSSNLGVVELTIAMHYVFDSPTDRLIFDVGHQGYTHKILTGRAGEFDRLRRLDGLSGFLKRNESIHDVWEAGHSSTALAALAGFETARVMNRGTYHNVALVGDGSLNSGLSFEALNFLGHRKDLAPIIILNDNEMSISRNVGTFAKILTSMRTTKPYLKATRVGNKIPKFLKDWKDRFGRMLRGLAKNMTIFDEFGFKYYGPIDGHNLKTLIKYLQIVRDLNRPCVLHVVTQKGKGYAPAENDKVGLWHGVKPFVPETGLPREPQTENRRSWSKIISEYLIRKASADPDFRVIVPAMVSGSDLLRFQAEFPHQLIDVGICEAFAVCYAGALAMEKKPVFVPIYSSFLQRAYDQMNHDIARQNLHVVFGLDRAGIVGEDGETHQGLYDIAYLRHLPNVTLLQGCTPEETHALLDYGFFVATGPVVIRYSNASVDYQESLLSLRETIQGPSWTRLSSGGKINVVAYGDTVMRLQKALEKVPLPVNLYNARFLKPLPEEPLRELFTSGLPILVVEDVVMAGGLGSALFEWAQAQGFPTDSLTLRGYPDRFIEQGTPAELRVRYGLDEETLLQTIRSLLK